MGENSSLSLAPKAIAVLLCIQTIAIAQAGDGPETGDVDSPQTAAQTVVNEHLRLVNKADAKAISLQTVTTPLMWRGENGKRQVLFSAQEVDEFFANTFARNKEDDRWDRTTTNSIVFCPLTKRMVLVDCNVARRSADGSTIGTDSLVYVVAKSDPGWRISAMYAYDKEKSLRTSLVDEKHEDGKKVTALIDKHQRLFNASDANAISKQTVSAPWQNRAGLARTRQDVENGFATMLARATEQGWKRSVKRELDVYQLRDDLAFADYTYTRLDTDDKEIMTAGCVYVVGKSEDGWKIISQYGRAKTNSLSATINNK